jgi:ABC-type transport system involved in multi-copper enzyme maturation permease subunit
MLAILIRKDLLSHLLSLRFVITLLLQVAALLASFVVMSGQYETALGQYNANVAAAQSANASGSEIADNFDYEHRYRRGSYAARPPHPSSWLVRGLVGAIPTQIHVSDHHQRTVDKRLFRNPIMERVSAPDLLFLARMLLSLLAVLFAFDAICGEREDGTLKQALAGATPRHLWMLGKWIGGMLTLSIGFVLGLLVGLLYLILQGVPSLSTDQLALFLAAFGVTLLYMSVFFTLGMLISAWVRHASTSIVVSLLLWALITLILPGMAVEAGKVLSPSRSSTLVKLEKEKVEREGRLAVRKIRREMQEDKEGRDAQTKKLRVEVQQELKALEADYWRGVLNQVGIVSHLARLFPSGCLTHALTGMAGTDAHLMSGFLIAQSRFKVAYEASISHPQPKHQYGTDPKTVLPETQNTLPTSLDIPFRTTEDRLGSALPDIGILVGYLIALFAAAYFGFLRYDIR